MELDRDIFRTEEVPSVPMAKSKMINDGKDRSAGSRQNSSARQNVIEDLIYEGAPTHLAKHFPSPEISDEVNLRWLKKRLSVPSAQTTTRPALSPLVCGYNVTQGPLNPISNIAQVAGSGTVAVTVIALSLKPSSFASGLSDILRC